MSEHAAEALRLLREAETLRRSPSSRDHRRRTEESVASLRAELLARAQVHATLARLAAPEATQGEGTP